MNSPLYCTKSVTRQRSDGNSRILEYANANRNKRYFNDITVSTGKKAFQANRIILSCYSKFFEEKFEANEKFRQFIHIENIESKTLENVINFIYSGKITIDQDNVIDLLKAGHKLKLAELKNFCLKFLESVANTNNCFYLLEIANLYQNNMLRSAVYDYMSKNVPSIIQSFELKKLSKKGLLNFLTILNQIKPGKMRPQYNAIISWTKFDEKARMDDFPYLFQLLNLSQMPNNFLMNIVSKEKLVLDSLICSSLVFEYIFEVIDKRELKYNKLSVVSMGGTNTRHKVTEVYNSPGVTPKHFPQLPENLIRPCSIKMANSIVCIGGDVTGAIVGTQKVWQMDLLKEHLQWIEIANMNQRRCYMGAAILHHCLVVAGGNDGNKFLTSAESYIKESNHWRVIASLNEGRRNHMLVSCKDNLFALGGFDGGKALSTVERLNSLNGNWKYVQSMNYPRSLLAAVAYKDKVYAIGGLSTNNPSAALKSVEVFDLSNWRWTEVKNLNSERWAHSACVLQDKIIVVGGKNREGKFVKEIECYDLARDVWYIVGETVDEWGWNALVSL